MPAVRSIQAEIPVSKSQKFKGQRLARAAKQPPKIYGGTCSRCGQHSSTCRPGTYHVKCGEDRSEIGLLMKTSQGRNLLSTYLGIEGQGKWLSTGDYQQFKVKIGMLIENFVEVDPNSLEVEFLRKTPAGRLLGKKWFAESFTLTSENYQQFLKEFQELIQTRNFSLEKGWGTLGEHYGYLSEQAPVSEPSQMPMAA